MLKKPRYVDEDKCTACGECLDQCPQNIEIPTWMEKAQAFLAG